MIVITDNIEDIEYHYKEWYNKMTNLIGTQFDTTNDFENSLSIGHKIHIDKENPVLPDGMSISACSKTTLDDLRSTTLVVLSISQIGNTKTINVGIRSTTIEDGVE